MKEKKKEYGCSSPFNLVSFMFWKVSLLLQIARGGSGIGNGSGIRKEVYTNFWAEANTD